MSTFKELAYKDLSDYEFENRIAGHHGKGVNKSIDAVVSLAGGISYRVTSDKKLIKETRSLGSAIQAFNEAK